MVKKSKNQHEFKFETQILNGIYFRLCSMKPENIGPHGALYVFSREFAVTHPHDNKISVMGTDDITTSQIIVIKHAGK